MKTIMTNGVTEGMFWLNKNEDAFEDYNNFINEENLIQVESKISIIDSIIETIVEPIIYKC